MKFLFDLYHVSLCSLLFYTIKAQDFFDFDRFFPTLPKLGDVEKRRAPSRSPISFGKTDGSDVGYSIPGLGSLNVEKSDINTATFVPVGSESQNAQDSNQNNQKDSGLGTGTGRERHNFLSLPGVGSFDVMEKKNDDAALSTILSRIFPTLPEFETLLNNRDKNEPSDQQNSYASHIYNNAQDNAEVNQQKLGEKIVLLHDQMTSIKENELPALQSSLSKQERRSLCKQLSFAFTKFCKGSTTEAKFLPLCQQYYKDCAEFLPEIMPLSHVANFWKSQVGLSPVNWGISGIPYYAINDQGEVSGGQSGKVDFGTYGGGYSDNTGVRDFWNLRREAGANWHKGIYGVNRAWDVPIAKDFGIEGGSGAYVKVPINEHEFGQPIELFTGNHVGPYLGTGEHVKMDLLNGHVSKTRSFASPITGITANSGSAVNFPIVSKLLSLFYHQ